MGEEWECADRVMQRLHPIIMCGGGGTRLWPLSRTAQPKQYLDILGDQSLLEATARRLVDAPETLGVMNPVVICGSGQADEVKAHLSRVGLEASMILEEPMKRNTAAVAAAACAHICDGFDEADQLLLLPADHYVVDVAGFWSAVQNGQNAANSGHLVTLGIDAVSAHTGYGYIKAGGPISETVFSVDKFVEKPDKPKAERFLSEGGYYWNAGIFLSQASTLRSAFRTHAPDILSAMEKALQNGARTGNILQLEVSAFEKSPSAPVDTAIMEKADAVAVVAPVRIGWSDVGSWGAVADLADVLRADKFDHISLDSENCFMLSDGPKIAALGVQDLVIIASKDTVLVIPRDRAEEVKRVVDAIRASGDDQLL